MFQDKKGMDLALFILLRLGIETISTEDEKVKELLYLPMVLWKETMSLAEKQGMAAIAFDGVQRLYESYGKEISASKNQYSEWMQWVFTCTGTMSQYEQRCLAQRKVIAELADIWAKEDINMLVFKGQANASLYPTPTHRPTGDIDCYLFGHADEGDSILKKLGFKVDNSWYRHSKILFKGETIENHRVMSHTRGSQKKKAMEEELKLLAFERTEGVECKTEGLSNEESLGCALLPSAQFNACFLTYHGLHHFLSEGLRMKQILDWAMFLKKEQDKVNWAAFNDFCERYQLSNFAAVMNYIATTYLGIKLKCKAITTDGTYAERIIQSTLYDDYFLFNSGKSDWQVRWHLVKNMLIRDKWKYKNIAKENVWHHLWHSATGFLLKEQE